MLEGRILTTDEATEKRWYNLQNFSDGLQIDDKDLSSIEKYASYFKCVIIC
jgi:hypothetical protein